MPFRTFNPDGLPVNNGLAVIVGRGILIVIGEALLDVLIATKYTLF